MRSKCLLPPDLNPLFSLRIDVSTMSVILCCYNQDKLDFLLTDLVAILVVSGLL